MRMWMQWVPECLNWLWRLLFNASWRAISKAGKIIIKCVQPNALGKCGEHAVATVGKAFRQCLAAMPD